MVGFASEAKEVARGTLYLLDPSKSTERVERLDVIGISDNEHFSPHGLHHWAHENGTEEIILASSVIRAHHFTVTIKPYICS